MAKILIVEDQKAVAGALRTRVRGLGHDAVIAKCGEDAIKKAATFNPDLILMDIMLGAGIDGIEATQRIREKSDVPVIYVTAHATGEILDRAKLTYPSGIINKPYTTKDLLTSIAVALPGSHENPSTRDRQTRGSIPGENTAQPGRSAESIVIDQIRFRPEHRQAAIGILSYFSEVLAQKYPDLDIGVAIEQHGAIVRLIIEAPDGMKEVIDRTLYDYGMVVSRKAPASLLFEDSVAKAQLENKIAMLELEVRFNAKLLEIKDERLSELRNVLEQTLSIIPDNQLGLIQVLD